MTNRESIIDADQTPDAAAILARLANPSIVFSSTTGNVRSVFGCVVAFTEEERIFMVGLLTACAFGEKARSE
jgi:hypothetical protein